MGINLRQNKIVGSSAYGKYYPEVDQQKTLSLRGFAKHMTDHGSLYGRAIVEGVLMQITDCLPELVAQGVPVQLGNLGTFYPTAEVAKNGAVRDIPEMDGLNPNDIVKAIHIRFLPEQTTEENISSRQFLKQAEFINVDSLLKKEEEGSLTPDPSPTGEGSGNSGGGNSGGNGDEELDEN